MTTVVSSGDNDIGQHVQTAKVYANGSQGDHGDNPVHGGWRLCR